MQRKQAKTLKMAVDLNPKFDVGEIVAALWCRSICTRAPTKSHPIAIALQTTTILTKHIHTHTKWRQNPKIMNTFSLRMLLC